MLGDNYKLWRGDGKHKMGDGVRVAKNNNGADGVERGDGMAKMMNLKTANNNGSKTHTAVPYVPPRIRA